MPPPDLMLTRELLQLRGRVAQLLLLAASVIDGPRHLEASAARGAKLGDESRNRVPVPKHMIHNVPNLLIHWDARLMRADHPGVPERDYCRLGPPIATHSRLVRLQPDPG